MAEDQMRMPMSSGGLVRYFEEYKSKLQLDPMHVVFIIAAVIVIEIVVRL